MVGNYSIECCIGVRHTECLSTLFHYISREDCIDKINLLVASPNTLENIKKCISEYTSIKDKIAFSIYHHIDNCDEVRKKYKNNNIIYLYIDDDICYLSQNAIQKLAQWHIDNSHIISYPSVANTGTTTFIWQIMGILPIFKDSNSKIEDTDYYWVDCTKLSSQNTITIHNKIIGAISNNTNLSFYKYNLYRAHEMYKQCYMWTGGENCQVVCNKLFDEHPEKFCINGDVIAAHFAFQNHRSDLIKTDLLTKYSKLY